MYLLVSSSLSINCNNSVIQVPSVGRLYFMDAYNDILPAALKYSESSNLDLLINSYKIVEY